MPSMPYNARMAALLAVATLAGCAKPAPPPPPPPAPVVEEVIPDAPFCAKPTEKVAFDVIALKTRLMIAALGCGNSDAYNGFVTKNRSALAGQEKALDSYFTRNYGNKSGASAHDDFITQLANMQAQRRTRDTEAFCRETGGIFTETSGLKTTDDLTKLASAKSTPQPMKVAQCQ